MGRASRLIASTIGFAFVLTACGGQTVSPPMDLAMATSEIRRCATPRRISRSPRSQPAWRSCLYRCRTARSKRNGARFTDSEIQPPSPARPACCDVERRAWSPSFLDTERIRTIIMHRRAPRKNASYGRSNAPALLSLRAFRTGRSWTRQRPAPSSRSSSVPKSIPCVKGSTASATPNIKEATVPGEIASLVRDVSLNNLIVVRTVAEQSGVQTQRTAPRFKQDARGRTQIPLGNSISPMDSSGNLVNGSFETGSLSPGWINESSGNGSRSSHHCQGRAGQLFCVHGNVAASGKQRLGLNRAVGKGARKRRTQFLGLSRLE